MITPQEAQDLINKEDWNSLSKTEFLVEFTKGHEQFAIKKSFIFDFIFNKQLFKTAMKSANWSIGNTEYFWQHVTLIINEQLQDLTLDEWELLVSQRINFLESGDLIDVDGFSRFFLFTDKPPNFFKMMLNENLYTKFVDLMTLLWWRSSALYPSQLQGLSHPEKVIIASRLLLNGKHTIRFFGDLTFYSDFGINLSATVAWVKITSLKPGLVFANMEQRKFEAMLLREGTSLYFADRWLVYYSEKTDMRLSDEFISAIYAIAKQSSTFINIIHLMTDEQLRTFGDQMGLKLLVNANIPLDKIHEYIPSFRRRARKNMLGARFFTEEEIAAHPNLFDPSMFKHNDYGVYVSRDTFKILNRTWGTKQRYDGDLVNFRKIVKKIKKSELSIGIVRYLIKKTGVDNNEVAETIQQLSTTNKTKNNESIYTLGDFLNKY